LASTAASVSAACHWRTSAVRKFPGGSPRGARGGPPTC
jgi:hypothetical protein